MPIRIWVTLDESPRSSAALSAAAALAAELDAELAGLFVEDVDLQHLVGLPFAREFSLLSGAARTLTPGEIERGWRREAERMQRRLAEMAGTNRLRWSFRVARGRVTAEVSLQAQAFDFVVLGQRCGIGIAAIGRATWSAAAPAARSGPVLVLFEDRTTSARSLQTAATLARRDGAELVLLIPAGDDAAFGAVCAAAREELGRSGAIGRCVRIAALDATALARVARREGASCLVLADTQRYLAPGEAGRALDALDCPVVLTRQGTAGAPSSSAASRA